MCFSITLWNKDTTLPVKREHITVPAPMPSTPPQNATERITVVARQLKSNTVLTLL